MYLDIGRFGGLAETEDEATRYRLTTQRDGTEDGPVIIADPTCDSADTLYEHATYRLPLALKAGDRVRIHAAGAYITTMRRKGLTDLGRWTGITFKGEARGVLRGTLRVCPRRLVRGK